MKTLGKIAIGGVILTWGVRFVGIIVILMLLGGVFSYYQVKNSEPPAIEEAAWSIQTYTSDPVVGLIPSRIYYAQFVTYDGDTPIIKNYWWLDGSKFRFEKEDKRLDGYGKIDIKRR